jgi:hypothetical protein
MPNCFDPQVHPGDILIHIVLAAMMRVAADHLVVTGVDHTKAKVKVKVIGRKYFTTVLD